MKVQPEYIMNVTIKELLDAGFISVIEPTDGIQKWQNIYMGIETESI